MAANALAATGPELLFYELRVQGDARALQRVAQGPRDADRFRSLIDVVQRLLFFCQGFRGHWLLLSLLPRWPL